MPDFSHLHVHTQFSLLDGAADITRLFKKAEADGMKAMAITDHGNMFGVFKFVAEAKKFGIKPIVGCEFYVVADRHKKVFTKENRDQRFHQLLLAKNTKGVASCPTNSTTAAKESARLSTLSVKSSVVVSPASLAKASTNAPPTVSCKFP